MTIKTKTKKPRLYKFAVPEKKQQFLFVFFLFCFNKIFFLCVAEDFLQMAADSVDALADAVHSEIAEEFLSIPQEDVINIKEESDIIELELKLKNCQQGQQEFLRNLLENRVKPPDVPPYRTLEMHEFTHNGKPGVKFMCEQCRS